MALRYEDHFLEFWNLYPRRVAKIAAAKAFNRAINMGVEHEIIIAGVRKYTRSVAGKEEQYIAHPASWLNGGRWDDEYAQPSSNRQSPKGKIEIAAELMRDLQEDQRQR